MCTPGESDLPVDIHCTMYCSPGPDRDYEHKFLKADHTNLQLTRLFWNTEGMCTAACVLSPGRQKLFYMHKPSHISLRKPKTSQWRDVGCFVRDCLRADNWVMLPGGVFHSRQADTYSQTLNWHTPTIPTVHLK